MFIFSIKNIYCSIKSLPSNIAFPYTSNGLIFLRSTGTVVHICSPRNTCVVVFLNIVTGPSLLKRNSSTGVFM